MSWERALLVGLPAVIILGLVVTTVFGDNGLVELVRLRRQAEADRAQLVAEDRENDRLLLAIERQKRDPVVVQRYVADELGLAPPGAQLYVFEGDELVERR